MHPVLKKKLTKKYSSVKVQIFLIFFWNVSLSQYEEDSKLKKTMNIIWVIIWQRNSEKEIFQKFKAIYYASPVL